MVVLELDGVGTAGGGCVNFAMGKRHVAVMVDTNFSDQEAGLAHSNLPSFSDFNRFHYCASLTQDVCKPAAGISATPGARGCMTGNAGSMGQSADCLLSTNSATPAGSRISCLITATARVTGTLHIKGMSVSWLPLRPSFGGSQLSG